MVLSLKDGLILPQCIYLPSAFSPFYSRAHGLATCWVCVGWEMCGDLLAPGLPAGQVVKWENPSPHVDCHAMGLGSGQWRYIGPLQDGLVPGDGESPTTHQQLRSQGRDSFLWGTTTKLPGLGWGRSGGELKWSPSKACSRGLWGLIAPAWWVRTRT